MTYAVWEKHDLEAFRYPDIITDFGREIYKSADEFRPFVWSRALAAPATVFFSQDNEDGRLYARRSVVLWSAIFAFGGLASLLWLSKAWPLDNTPPPVLEYAGIPSVMLPYYQDYFGRTITRLEANGLTNEHTVCEAGSKIRLAVAEEFKGLGYDPMPLHIAVQQYLCADPMFRDMFKDEWVKTVMYERATFKDMVIGDTTDYHPKTIPYPPACRVARSLYIDLNIGK